MCGICGFVGRPLAEPEKIINKMLGMQQHRGPDDKGFQIMQVEEQAVVLGHNRLSIIDLSATGHQPMNLNELSIVLNGEIYNYSEIKKELIALGHSFVSTSDTEVVLHSFKEWGCDCVHRFIGMFVFVIADTLKQELYIFRDRSGVKPLYYYEENGVFIFSSELKSFHAHPAFFGKINIRAVDLFMKFGYIPSPDCIFDKCRKLDAGHYLTYKITSHRMSLKRYWSIFACYAKPKLSISYPEAKEELENTLKSAFLYRMVADVPVGVFLSGGYDSSAVVAILQSSMTGNLKTFTIGFPFRNDEAPYARLISKHLGTEHTEYYCTEKDAQDIIRHLPFYYDEPFADSSAIPTILVSKIARKEVKVALSADGGDEIFAGYDAYKTYLNHLSTLKSVPLFVAYFLKYVKYICPDKYQKIKRRLFLLEDVFNASNATKREKIWFGTANHSAVFCKERMYHSFDPHPFAFDNQELDAIDDLSFALSADYYMYLQNDLLTKTDRATMSVSLEGREPFLDHRIIEFAAQLPNAYKMNENNSKIILKDIVHKYIPFHMMDRPKTGFSIPIDRWLAGDLKYFLNEFLNENIVDEAGVFNYEYVSFVKKMFLNGQLHDKVIIWKLLMFHMWFKRWLT